MSIDLMILNGFPHIDPPVLANKQKIIFISSVLKLDAVGRIYKE